MVKYQAFNKRIRAWVMYELVRGKFRVTNVKQREPLKKFKGVRVRGQKR